MQFVVIALSAAALMAGQTFAADGKAIYESTCKVCHDQGVAGAPRTGDNAAWASRIKTGEAALIQSVTKGKGAMPAKAGNAALSDADIKASVQFMTSASK
ncbi:MAG: cytochrome c5 family protein [Betaproteobacteria bacterium]|nr:MAG: cytochrome c5 family protein [Betaproteobacteria bacterium]